MKYKYLIYAIDKHQSSPYFTNEIPQFMLSAEGCSYDVVVDLENHKRLWDGEWAEVDVHMKLNPQSTGESSN